MQNIFEKVKEVEKPISVGIKHFSNKAIISFKIQNGWKLYGPSIGDIGKQLSIEISKSFNIKNYRFYYPTENKSDISEQQLSCYYYENAINISLLIEPEDINKAVEFTLVIEGSACNGVCILINEELNYKFLIDKIADTSDIPQIKHNILAMGIFGLIGGILLNFMPCVLPVLSLKIVSMVKKSGKNKYEIRMHSLGIISGILFIFLINAFVVALMRDAGKFAGWGMHFQSKYFLMFLIVAVTFFANSLYGLFQIQLPHTISNKIDKILNVRYKYVGDFLYGAFGTLLATSCTAPVLSTSVIFALSQDSHIIFLIYMCIGIGMSFPYIMLLISPKLIKILPKPGPWMIKIKKFFAILMLLTAMWLIPVLQKHIGWQGTIAFILLLALLILSFSLKGNRYKLLAIPFVLIFFLPQNDDDQVLQDKYWQKFSIEKLNKNLDQGKSVLVDITADWCVTCKYNAASVFTVEFLEYLHQKGVVLLQGDYTLKSDEIAKFLEKNDQLGVPCNIFYSPSARDGIHLSELLSKQELVDILEKN